MKPPPLQEILEAQGYLILGSLFRREIGEIVPGFDTPGHKPDRVDYPVVVIGYSDRGEFDKQAATFGPPDSKLNPKWKFFHKVIAE